jgi:hypothetical protein
LLHSKLNVFLTCTTLFFHHFDNKKKFDYEERKVLEIIVVCSMN